MCREILKKNRKRGITHQQTDIFKRYITKKSRYYNIIDELSRSGVKGQPTCIIC